MMAVRLFLIMLSSLTPRETTNVTPARRATTPNVPSCSLPFPDDATQDGSGLPTCRNRDLFVPRATSEGTEGGGQDMTVTEISEALTKIWA